MIIYSCTIILFIHRSLYCLFMHHITHDITRPHSSSPTFIHGLHTHLQSYSGCIYYCHNFHLSSRFIQGLNPSRLFWIYGSGRNYDPSQFCHGYVAFLLWGGHKARKFSLHFCIRLLHLRHQDKKCWMKINIVIQERKGSACKWWDQTFEEDLDYLNSMLRD